MSDSLMRHLKQAREAVIAGDAARAMAAIEKLSKAGEMRVDDAARPNLQRQVEELHQLALAAQKGARMAIDQVRAIVEAARSLQTYDSVGARRVAITVAPVPRRY